MLSLPTMSRHFFLLMILLLTTLLTHAHAAETTEALAMPAAPYLEIYLISPPRPLNWESPKTLLIDTLRNALSGDYAPNSHYLVHLVLEKPRNYGVQEVLTGMSRTHKMQTVATTLIKELGLSAMTYVYPGELDASKDALKELKKATNAKRLSRIIVKLDESKADELMNFLEYWIRYGSFHHYAGGKDVGKGEGAGCADFALYFLNQATNGKAPLTEWSREVYLPNSLMKEKMGKGISMAQMLGSTPWAKDSSDGVYFFTLDPDKMDDWFKQVSPTQKTVLLTPEFLNNQTIHPIAEKIQASQFEYLYPAEKEETIAKIWKSISVRQKRP